MKKENKNIKSLKENFIELIDYDHIPTIKELCIKSDIDRSTFYLHYSNIYDLINEILEEWFMYIDPYLIQSWDALMDKNLSESSDTLKSVLLIYQNNRLILKKLMMMDHGFTYLNQMNRRYFNKLNISNYSEEERLIFKYRLYGSAAVIEEWILGDCKIDVDKIAKLCIVNLPDIWK